MGSGIMNKTTLTEKDLYRAIVLWWADTPEELDIITDQICAAMNEPRSNIRRTNDGLTDYVIDSYTKEKKWDGKFSRAEYSTLAYGTLVSLGLVRGESFEIIPERLLDIEGEPLNQLFIDELSKPKYIVQSEFP